jgi:hypothetical protein
MTSSDTIFIDRFLVRRESEIRGHFVAGVALTSPQRFGRLHPLPRFSPRQVYSFVCPH